MSRPPIRTPSRSPNSLAEPDNEGKVIGSGADGLNGDWVPGSRRRKVAIGRKVKLLRPFAFSGETLVPRAQPPYMWREPSNEVGSQMSQPVVVTIPHKLGKQEAARRLKAGFGNVRSTFGEKFVVLKDEWAGDHLDFRASLLGQTTTGTVDVAEDHVRLEVQLPWVLSLLANKAKELVQRQGKLMLEKPTKPRS
jgi:Putative polyhydroxyalkanoic acid system protein (PHA_gran_rgn)